MNMRKFDQSIYVKSKLSIGSQNQRVSLDMSGTTDAIALPIGTTLERPSADKGFIRYNTTLNEIESYNTTWKTILTTSSIGTNGQLLSIVNGVNTWVTKTYDNYSSWSIRASGTTDKTISVTSGKIITIKAGINISLSTNLTTNTITLNSPSFGTTNTTVAYGDHNHSSLYQPIGNYLDDDDFIGTSGLLKKTSTGSYSLDTSTYLTSYTNSYLSSITKSSNKLTYVITNGTNVEYTFGTNAFTSTTIPTNNTQLVNGAGYITSYTISNNEVESSMLNDNIISGLNPLTSGVVDADELLISDAGIIKRIDASVLKTYFNFGNTNGTVTSVNTSDVNGFDFSVSNQTTTPTISLNTDSSHHLPTTTEQSNWNTAYGWDDHSTKNYLVTTGDSMSGGLILNSTLKLTTGSPETGKILTSDSSGGATWQYASQRNSGSVTAGNWYRLATNSGSRADAEFTLTDGISGGGHSTLRFTVGINYGYIDGMSFTLLSHSKYGSTATFTKVRVLSKSTYDGAHVEVYCSRTGDVNYYIRDNYNLSSWVPVAWTAGTIPSGWVSTEYNTDKLFGVGDNFTVSIHGNIGIGKDIDFPTELLHIRSIDGASSDIGLQEGTGAGWRLRNDQVANDFRIASTTDFSTFVDKFVIKNDGDIGFGISPNYNLHIHENASNSDTRFQLTNSDTGSALTDGFMFILNGSNYSYKVNILNRENSDMGFWTNNTERMIITAAGDVNMVKTLTAYKLRATSTGDASLTSTAHGFQVGSTTSTNIIIDNNEIMGRNNGVASTLYLNSDGGDVIMNYGTNKISFVDGKVYSKQIVLDIPIGTAPLVVTSSTVVTKLNVDMVDGKHAYQFTPNVSVTRTFTAFVSHTAAILSSYGTETASSSVVLSTGHYKITMPTVLTNPVVVITPHNNKSLYIQYTINSNEIHIYSNDYMNDPLEVSFSIYAQYS